MSFNIIYVLRNSANNKVYVRQTWQSLKDRWDSGYGYSGCKYIENAIKKYGVDSFYYEVLTVAHTQECADYWETYFISSFNSNNKKLGYNLRAGGSRGKHSERSKKKMIKAHTGKKASLATKKKMSDAHIGLNTWLKGGTLSSDHKIKISKSLEGNQRALGKHKGKTWKIINNKRVWLEKGQ